MVGTRNWNVPKLSVRDVLNAGQNVGSRNSSVNTETGGRENRFSSPVKGNNLLPISLCPEWPSCLWILISDGYRRLFIQG
jgi:hypothetical protein